MKNAYVTRRQAGYLFLLLFISAFFLFAEYFHTETDIGQNEQCPICRWEQSLFTSGQVHFFAVLFVLILFSRLILAQNKNQSLLLYHICCCRAPPSR
jgi:hypothetical protein